MEDTGLFKQLPDFFAIYDSTESLSRALADEFITLGRKAIEKKDSFSVVLTGGNSPTLTYQLLAEHYREALDWSKVYIFWGDERWVPVSDDRSNAKMAKEQMLDKLPIPIENVYIMEKSDDIEKDASVYQARLVSFFKGAKPAFDLVHLGMGSDGHTASLFPGMPSLKEKKKLILSTENPELREPRVTMTYPLLNAAAKISFIVYGGGKAQTLYQLFIEKDANLPVYHICPKHGELSWYCDREAVKLLVKQ